MKRQVKIYAPRGHVQAYFGKGMQEYVGTADTYFNGVTATIVKPGASIDDVIRSLQFTLQEVKMLQPGQP